MSPRLRTIVGGGVATVVALVVMGACSGGGSSNGSSDPESNYDSEGVAQQILEEQQAKVPGLEVDNATCPAEVTVEEGESFECSVDVAGVTAPYDVTIKSIDGDTVNFDFKPAKAIVSMKKTQDFIVAEAKKQQIPNPKVTCAKGAAVVVQDAMTTFPCTLKVNGQPQKLTVEIKDTQGTIALK